MARRTTGLRAALATALFAPSLVLAHARLVSPAPRTTTILKTPPCGGIARTDTSTVLTAGDDVEVAWVETVDHPGHYELAISLAGDQDFATLLPAIPDLPFASGAAERGYTTMLHVPETPCEACTLRLIQFMSDHPPGSQYYYSCADIRIVAPGSTTTTPSGGSTTTTSTTVAPPAQCDGLVSYERATCLIAASASAAVCGQHPVGGRLAHVLDAGLAAVRRLLGDAVAVDTSRRRARLRLAAARRRLSTLRHRVALSRDRIDAACAQTIVARLADLRSSIDAMAPRP